MTCRQNSSPSQPDHYLIITHSALNRITFFDFASNQIVGALPTQKLPHDMLLSRDRILYVVNSGSQCITTYDLTKPELWEYAREFMKKDSTNLNSARTPIRKYDGERFPCRCADFRARYKRGDIFVLIFRFSTCVLSIGSCICTFPLPRPLSRKRARGGQLSCDYLGLLRQKIPVAISESIANTPTSALPQRI